MNIKSVDFSVNIFTTFSEGIKTSQKCVFVREISGFQLWLSISESTVGSTNHAVNLSGISEYENLTIHLRDLVIKSGDFLFENKIDKCKPLEHIKDIIEMYNVTICNTGNVTLSVHGCFNMSIEKLTCSNITWKKQGWFTFKGGLLNIKKVLIKNILANDKMKYNKSESKVLFLINESVAEMQNILIKDSVVMSSVRPKRFPAVIIAQNSVVRILYMKMVGNSSPNFVQANKSRFKSTLYKIDESNMTLCKIKLHRNKTGCFLSINRKSKVLIRNRSLIENEFFKKAFSISKSLIKLNNTNCHWNKKRRVNFCSLGMPSVKPKRFSAVIMVENSVVQILNMKMIENSFRNFAHARKSYLCFKNMILIENNVTDTLCRVEESNVTLHEIKFHRNKIGSLVSSNLKSKVLITNNSFSENEFFKNVYSISKSLMKLNSISFYGNKNRETHAWVITITN